MRRRLTFIIALIFLILSSSPLLLPADNQKFTCYTVLVGKRASADGSVMVAHNEDDYGDITVNVRKIRPRNYGASVRISLGHGGYYETDGRTSGFLWIEATTQEFADSFVNEHGVLITSDACASRETEEDYTDGGIGYMLRRIVAEKARSAREAVLLAGKLIEKYGYRASGRTYSIADKDEAWMLAVIRGRHWFARRVPDDEVAVIPNYYTIREINPDDPENFLGSREIIEYAEKKGWYDRQKDGPFDFKKVFSRPSSREPIFDGNTLRMWRGLEKLSGKKWEIGGDYPFSFKPAKKVTVEMLIELLRDHYEGTEYDATDGYTSGSPNRTKFRTICTSSTINSFVAVLNKRKPEPLSIMLWLAFGKPDTTIYLPLYYGVESLPSGAGYGPIDHDYEIFYSQHFQPDHLLSVKDQLLNTMVLKLERKVEENYGERIEIIRKELHPLEREFLKNWKPFEQKFTAGSRKNPEKAAKMLHDYVSGAFEQTVNTYRRLLAEH